MMKVINFGDWEPVYCAQDIRDFIGYIIEDVVSDENDCGARLVLRDEKTGRRVFIALDKALDGETLFMQRLN